MKNDRAWVPGAREMDWIEELSTPPIQALLAIEEAAAPDRIPIVDRDAGRALSALATGRRRIVEVGTAFGYSTLWLALGQPADGTIVTIDPDRERTDLARGWWRQAGIADDRISVVTAKALEAFEAGEPLLDGPFDLAFIDALKPEYEAYVSALVPRLAPGALLVADNVLWSGRVVDESVTDESTTALRAFDSSLLRDSRFNATILPLGDGLLVAGFRG